LNDSLAIKDIVMLGIGLAGGYAISFYFFKRQKNDSNVTHAELIAALDRNYEQALRSGVKHSSVIHSVRSIEDEVKGLSDLVEIKEKMDVALSTLKSINKGQEPPLEDILRYKTLGDRWSELVSTRLDLKIIDNHGKITIPRLLAVHKSIFPADFPWAGKYRTQHVYVVDNFGTTARVVDIVQAESRTETIPPESIQENLAKLLNHWNGSVNSLIGREPIVKIDEVANFHHEFELIHPFLDGNGRIGRMLLGEQLSLLFQTQISFRPERDDYYMALRMMNMGQLDNFRDLVSRELRRFNVAL
jgi:fido (protein-threonine AMPylation protein)